MTHPPIRKWYFAINASGLKGYGDLIKAAVISAKKNTGYQPICLYDGEMHPLVDWLKHQGVRIVPHRVSVANAISVAKDKPPWNRNIASGAYLRIDIPLIEDEDDFVLYTDCDVIFLAHPSYDCQPDLFSAAPEHDPEEWTFINTGSMVINVPAMRESHSSFVDFILANLTELRPYDQGAINRFYAGKWSRLPLTMNWKPYWGINQDAEIVHFHGPKPQHIAVALARGEDQLQPPLKGLFARAPEAAAYYLGRFDELSRAF